MVKVNRVSKKNRISKRQYSRSTKKGGGTKTIMEGSDKEGKIVSLSELVKLVKEKILPQSNEEDIERYLKLINYYYHYY